MECQVHFPQGNQKRTSFGKIEALFTEIRNKAEEGDEASEGGANNIEIGYSESRHSLAILRGIKSSSSYIIQSRFRRGPFACHSYSMWPQKVGRNTDVIEPYVLANCEALERY